MLLLHLKIKVKRWRIRTTLLLLLLVGVRIFRVCRRVGASGADERDKSALASPLFDARQQILSLFSWIAPKKVEVCHSISGSCQLFHNPRQSQLSEI